MGYKIFHFSIKTTHLDLTKIQQHNDCTVVKPKIKKSHVKKIHSQYFPKSNYKHKDLWSSSKYKIRINSTKFHRNLFFSKPCMHILQKIFAYTKCHILTFTTFTSHLILYIITTQRLGLRILEKSLGFNTCT